MTLSRLLHPKLKRGVRRAHRLLTAGRKRALILVYHRVAEPEVDPWALCVSPQHFREQLGVLRREADLVPLEALVSAQEDGDLPRRPVAVTFDDGYADNLLHALPILESERVPATVFVATGFLDAEAEVWSDELARLVLGSAEDPRLLAASLALPLGGAEGERSARPWRAWEPAWELRQELYRVLYRRLLPAAAGERSHALACVRRWSGSHPELVARARFLTTRELIELAASPVIEVGAHTVSHSVLARQSVPEQREEIAGSKRQLELLTGRAVRHFAYPYGKREHFSTATAEAVRQAGLRCGCANYGRPVTRETSRWALPRYQVLDWESTLFQSEIQRWFRE